MKRTRGYTIAVHLICWLIFLSLPAVFVANLSGKMNFAALSRPFAWLFFGIYIVIFYLHTNFLLPKLYFGRHYFLYFMSMLLLAVAVFYMRPFDRLAHMGKRNRNWENERNGFRPPQQQGMRDSAWVHFRDERPAPFKEENNQWRFRPKLDIVSIVLFIMIIALSVSMLITKRWRMAVEQAATAEADKVNAELAILKAQINPHFLFNTLNNIYSQAVMHDEKTAESIMKLSNIMRYVTDDATENFVSLVSEANFISNYIELQRLRLGSKVTLDFAINGEMGDKMIAPLILITFIENIFKYGISNNEPSVITIELRAYRDSIAFFCRNKLFPLKHQVERTGIGIQNTIKRLEHLYPGKHTLTIREEDGYYSVHLILQS